MIWSCPRQAWLRRLARRDDQPKALGPTVSCVHFSSDPLRRPSQVVLSTNPHRVRKGVELHLKRFHGSLRLQYA